MAAGTDVARGWFRADSDTASTTDPRLADHDGGGAPDGAEDRDADGAVEAGETDPQDPADDPACDADPPPPVRGVRASREGSDVVLSWSSQTQDDPCVLYRVYAHRTSAIQGRPPDSFDDFQALGTTGAAQFRDAGIATDPFVVYYLVTAIGPVMGEGPLGHYGL